MLTSPKLLAVLAILATAPSFAAAQDTAQVQGQDTAGIEDVIASQLDAFNNRDLDTAWTFASPMIQGLFGTPQNFGMMVENGYPMVWTNSDRRFLQADERGGRIYQRVMVRDARGALHILEYAMIPVEDGWQIDGVSILPAPDTGV